MSDAQMFYSEPQNIVKTELFRFIINWTKLIYIFILLEITEIFEIILDNI